MAFGELYQLLAPVPLKMWCQGSIDGWVITVDGDMDMDLFNPFSGEKIFLAPLDKYPCSNRDSRHYNAIVQKAVLSSRPTSSHDQDYMILAVNHTSVLSFFKPGYRAWPRIHYYLEVSDIIYFKGQFYFVKYDGELFICEIGRRHRPKATIFAPPPMPTGGHAYKWYLVELAGELLLFKREYLYRNEGSTDSDESEYGDEANDYIKGGFRVFMVDLSGEPARRWIEVKSLGDHMLLLSDNGSFSLSASNFSSPSSCRGNCIYFVDYLKYYDYFERTIGNPQPLPYNVCVFNLADGTIEQLCQNLDVDSSMMPPIWIAFALQ
ncbi:F-box protein At2g17036-like [Tasmannia lanceolata]|uniref:F-box protein At2g17036-like n=1 Tax=Tasmannia lanceolata TaxID=3420 RepID=UPI0040635EC8